MGVLIVVATIIVFYGQSEADKFCVVDGDDGTVYLELDFSNGDEFYISFIHSVNKTEVKEIYEIIDGEIYLTGCVYYSFGAGVAEELDPSWVLTYGTEGEMILSEINMLIPTLRYVVGTVSDHVLGMNGEEYSLRDICGRNSSVVFELK